MEEMTLSSGLKVHEALAKVAGVDLPTQVVTKVTGSTLVAFYILKYRARTLSEIIEFDQARFFRRPV